MIPERRGGGHFRAKNRRSGPEGRRFFQGREPERARRSNPPLPTKGPNRWFLASRGEEVPCPGAKQRASWKSELCGKLSHETEMRPRPILPARSAVTRGSLQTLRRRGAAWHGERLRGFDARFRRQAHCGWALIYPQRWLVRKFQNRLLQSCWSVPSSYFPLSPPPENRRAIATRTTAPTVAAARL